MPTELEQRLRAERPAEPEFSTDARERARSAALEARSPAARPRRARLRRLARPARVAVGGLGFAALAGLIALLVISGPHADQSAGLRFAGRSEGGVALRLKATPIRGSGLSAEAAAAQAANVLLARARAQGIEGVEAEAVGDGTLDAWIPVARTSGEVRRLLTPIELRVYRLDRDLVVRAPSAKQALLRAGALLPGAGSKQYFLVTGRAGGLLVAGPVSSRRALIARAGGRLPADSTVLAISAGYLLLRDSSARAWVVVHDRPVLEGTDVAAIDRRSPGLSLQLSAAGAERLARQGTGALAPRQLVLAFGEYLPPGQLSIAGDLTAASSGQPFEFELRSLAPGAREILAQNAPRGPLSARISSLDEAATGPARPRGGTSITGTALGQSVAQAMNPPPGSPNAPPGSGLSDPVVVASLRLAVEFRQPGRGTTSVVTGVNRQGHVFNVLADPSGRPIQMTGGGSGCQLTPWDPQVSVCVTGGLIGSGNLSIYGRVDARATRVVVEMSDGRRQRAAVANGWWLAVTASPVRSVVAYDAAGTVLATAAGG